MVESPRVVDETDRLVCVGGELDGRRYNVKRDNQTLKVPRQIQPPILKRSLGTIPDISAEISYVVYERTMYRAGDLTRFVLTPVGQTPEKTLELLLAGYAGDPEK